MNDGICVGCSSETLGMVECNCTQEISACEVCCESKVSLVCDTCRDRAGRVVPRAAYPCRDFVEDAG